jgi:hypothetical protein
VEKKMPARVPPPNWEKDKLSQYLQLAYNNQLSTAGIKSGIFLKLANIDALIFKIAENMINPSNATAINFFYRAHSAFRVASAAAMAGQVVESFVLIRSCLEYAAYGLHIFDDPKNGDVWWNRNKGEVQRKASIKLVALSSLRETIEKHDSKLACIFNQLYEKSIEFGAHPNQYGVVSSMALNELDDRTAVIHKYLHKDSDEIDFALKTVAQTGVFVLRVFQFTMPEKYMLLGVRDDILLAENGL